MAPWPLITVRIAASAPGLAEALAAHAATDAAFLYAPGEDGAFIMGGESEHHLDDAISSLRAQSGLALEIGAPDIAYRERINRDVEIDYTHKKMLAGGGEFARVRIKFERSAAEFAFEIKADPEIRPEFAAAVEAGLRAEAERGLRGGFPVIGLKATLLGGASHDMDSNPRAFELAARGAFAQLRREAGSRLLEPVMRIEVMADAAFSESIRADLLARRGVLDAGASPKISAAVPLSNLFGYRNTLRSMSGGRASFNITFSHYQDTPFDDGDPPFPQAGGLRA